MSEERERTTLESLEVMLAVEPESHDPARMAMLATLPFHPLVDIEECLGRIDALAARVKTRLGRARSPLRVIEAINHVLFTEEGFRPNTDDYYDPQNSFLPEVLDRKTGIPISLSIIYLAVAYRIKQPIVGVGLPFHFIVKFMSARGDLYIDPFHGGKILSLDECHARVERAVGAPVEFQESYLDAVSMRVMLYRVLNNLKQFYLRIQDSRQAGNVVDRMLLVMPEQAEEVRDRGLLYLQERRYRPAMEFLTQYLKRWPEAADREEVIGYLETAQERYARLN